ncbi:MAG: zinc-binding dehydrogenase [Alphaproteobacteria bacterium]|nr:zinc-binding dehydrogenase [Alphaproteobacteria bacterium]
MKVKAAVLRQSGLKRPYAESRPLTVEEIELDPPGPGEVLVAIKAAGLCHSDLSVITGDVPLPLPLVMGHEASGVVEALGPGVVDLAVGDHVVMLFVASCGSCGFCREARPALCEQGRRSNMTGTLLAGTRRLRADGAEMNHAMGASCFAERAVVSRGSLVRIDKAVPFEEAALFGCAVVTGVGAVINTAKVPAGASVAIVGLGGVGLNMLLGATLAGARQIVAIDVVADKLALAKSLGATDTFDAREKDLVRTIMKATNRGVDYAFETAGLAETLDLAYRITRCGGTTTTTSLPGRAVNWTVSTAHAVLEERTVKGSFMGSAVPSRDVPRYIELFRQGRLPVDRLKSNRVTLDRLNEGFDALAAGAVVRQILVFD